MSKDSAPQGGSVLPTDPRQGLMTSSNSRVHMIDLEDATDDEITSGMSTPTMAHFPTATPIPLPSSIETHRDTRIPNDNSANPPVVVPVVPEATAARRVFVTAVRIPIKMPSENLLSVDSPEINMLQRMQLEEALVYKQHVAKRMRESLAERLNLTYNRVTQWYFDHGERGSSMETFSRESPETTMVQSIPQNAAIGLTTQSTTTENLTAQRDVENAVTSSKRQHSPESDDISSSDDDGHLGSSLTWYQHLATPNKISRPKAADTSPGYFVNTLRTADVTRQLAPLLRGGAIVNVNDVKEFSTLMASTREMEGKKIFLNALRITGSQVVLKAFLRSDGSTTMQSWLRNAVDDMESPLNRDLVLQCIRILSKLPFDSVGLSDTVFGRIIQRLTTRASPDSNDEISQEAAKLKDKWTSLVREDGKPTSSSRQTRGLRRTPSSPTSTTIAGFEGFQGLSGLPKFTKKPSEPAPAALSEKPKPKIRVNTSFFDELKASTQSPSESPKKRQFAVRSEGKPTHARPAKRSSEITTPPRSPTMPATPTTPASPATPTTSTTPIMMRKKRDRDEDLTQENVQPRPDTNHMPTRMSMPLLTSSQKTKPKKTVRFKSDKDLVSIREIETRWERIPEEWQPDQSDSEDHDMGSDSEQDYHHTELEMPYPLEDDSEMDRERRARPVFNLPGDQIVALERGDFWYRPPLVSLEGIDVVHKVIVSTEYEYQARREMSTPPAMDNALMAIQLTPSEPTSPTLQSDFVDIRTMPLYEADSTDHAPELIQALQVVLQFLCPTNGNGEASNPSRSSESMLPPGQPPSFPSK